jgi:hypothetical protein
MVVLLSLLPQLTVVTKSEAATKVVPNVCGKNVAVKIERDKKDPSILIARCPNGTIGLRLKNFCVGTKVVITPGKNNDITMSCK